MEVRNSNWKSIARLRMVFFLSVLTSVLAVLYFLPRITIPFALSYLLYLILRPLMPLSEKFGMKRSLASILIVLASLFFIIYPVVVVAPRMVQDVDKIQYQIPKIEEYFRVNYTSLKGEIKKRTGHDIGEKHLDESIETARDWFKTVIIKLPVFLGKLVEWIFVVPLFLFFLLRDSRSLRDGLLKIVPNSIFEKYYNLTYQFNKKLGDYIFAKFIEATIVGSLITIGLALAGVRFSLLFGVIAAITNIIPYVGPILGALPGIIFGLVEYGASSPSFGGLLLVYLIANAIDLGLVFPILVSKLVDLHPAVVVISVILGSQFMGMTGMIISIPLAAAVKLIFSEIYNDLFIYGRRL